MQEFKKLKYVQKVLVFLLAFCIVFGPMSILWTKKVVV